MSNKVYQIQMKSPMGVKKGLAKIQQQENQMILELLGSENQFDGGFSQKAPFPGYVFQMSGFLKTALNVLPASLFGILSENRIQALLCTKQGDFPIKGILLEDSCVN